MITQPSGSEEQVDDGGQVAGSRTLRAGLVGAVLLLAGCSMYLALIGPPYMQDESGHVGYTLSLRQGTLPSLSSPVPTEGGGPEIERALARPWPYSVPTIHVANNPPFPYLVGLPLAEVTYRAGMPGGGLFGIRLLNLAGGVGAVVFTYLLARELSGGDRFVGLGAAGLLSGTIALAIVFSTANVDGPALAATTGATWALARFARTRAPGDALHLGIWCAAASAVRPMALAYSLVAGAIALLLALRAHGVGALVAFTTRLAAPTLLVVGWFYALNIYRYGDPTGTAALAEGASGPSRLDLLTGPEPFVQPLAYLVMEVYGRNPWWESTDAREYGITVVAVALLATTIVLALRSSRQARESGQEPRLVPAAWVSVTILVAVPMVLIAQHMSVGGAGHARYLIPVLPILASAAALVLSLIARWLTVVLVGCFAVAELTRLRAAGDLRLPIPGVFGGGHIGPSLGGQPFLALCAVVAIGGAVVLLAALGLMARARSDPSVPAASAGGSAQRPWSTARGC